MEIRVQSTEYGGQRAKGIGGRGLGMVGRCKGAKVNAKTGRGVAGQITEYGVQITEER